MPRTEQNLHLRLQRLLPHQQVMLVPSGWPLRTSRLMLPLETPASSKVQSDEIWIENPYLDFRGTVTSHASHWHTRPDSQCCFLFLGSLIAFLYHEHGTYKHILWILHSLADSISSHQGSKRFPPTEAAFIIPTVAKEKNGWLGAGRKLWPRSHVISSSTHLCGPYLVLLFTSIYHEKQLLNVAPHEQNESSYSLCTSETAFYPGKCLQNISL